MSVPVLDSVHYTGDLNADITALQAIFRTPGVASLDFETTIDTARGREVCTIQVTHENGAEAFGYIFGHGGVSLRRIFSGCRATVIAHNSMFEMECLAKAGVHIRVECTMIAAKVLRGVAEGDKSKRQLWSLKELAMRELGKERDKTIRDRDWRILPDAEAFLYGMDDTRDAMALWDIYKPMFDADVQQYDGYTTIIDSLPAIVEINLHGLPFEPEAHSKLTAGLEQDKQAHEIVLDLMCLNQITNHGSTKQVAEWMMDLMMVNYNEKQQRKPTLFSLAFQQATGQHWPTTKTGALALGKGVIESRLVALTKVAPDVAEYLVERLQWSKAAKMIQSFGDSLHKFVDDRGYIAGSLRPHGAWTSRLSMNSPNIQQMPGEAEFRALFKAKPGRKLVICDYGQIELRVGCIIADDKVMQRVFGEGEDIHRATATRIKRLLTGIKTAVASDLERKKSKGTTFGALYDAQAPTIALSSGLPLDQAQELLDLWLGVYTGIANWRLTAKSVAEKAGGIRLVSGQFIKLTPTVRNAQCVNAPVQGSAASVMYRAMTLTHGEVLEARRQDRDVWLAASIHDEIILDTADEDAEYARDALQRAMIEALLDMYPEASKLGMDSIADASIVESWAEK